LNIFATGSAAAECKCFSDGRKRLSVEAVKNSRLTAAGGASDITARLIGDELGRQFKLPVAVENKPGALVRSQHAMSLTRPQKTTLSFLVLSLRML